MREKEYDVPEPPDQDEDPQLLETGPSYSSDEAADGPFRREITKIKPTDLNTLARSKRTERDMALSKQSNSQMRNGEKRSERVQKYAPLGSVLSSSEQRSDPTIIVLGMGPEFSSDPAGDGPVYSSDTESSDGSESSYDPVEDTKRMKRKRNAKLNARRRKGDKRTDREKEVKNQSNAVANPKR